MPSDLLTINFENEQKILSYYLNHPEEDIDIESKYFLSSTSKAIINALKELNNQKLEFSLDTLHLLCKKEKDTIQFRELKGTKDSYTEHLNIEFHKKELKSDWLKYFSIKESLEKWLAEITTKGVIAKDTIDEHIRSLQDKLEQIEVEDCSSFSMKEAIDRHISSLEKRVTGFQRTTGYKELDKLIGNRMAPQQFTIACGMTGSGKSTFATNIAERLINKKVPVIYFAIEPDEETFMDSYISIKTGIPMNDLLRFVDLSEEQRNSIITHLKEIKDNPYFQLITLDSMNIPTADKLIAKAKKKFKAAGVLPEDGYCVVIVDLLSDFDEFEGEEKTAILKAVKKWNNLVKKHNIHGFCLVQANENKIRGGKMFKDPAELDSYRLGLEDIYGGTGYSKKAKLIFTIHRPVFMKKRMFPNHEDMEVWNAEPDILQVSCVKQNQGTLFFTQLVFDPECSRISYPATNQAYGNYTN